MIIVLVADTIDMRIPGLARNAALLLTRCEEAGHTVRLVACRAERTTPYSVRRRYLPILSRHAAREGIHYGKPDEQVLERALEGADLVLVAMPFGLGNKAETLARTRKIPVLAAVPLDHQGFMELSGLPFFRKKPGTAYWFFYNEFYCKLSNLICYSEEIKAALPAYDYSARLHVITPEELGTVATSEQSATPEDGRPSITARLDAILHKTIEDDRRTYADNSRQIFRRNWAILRSSIDVSNPYRRPGAFFRLWYALVYYAIAYTAAVACFFLYGMRKKNGKYFREVKGGAITISNHIHNVDGAMVAVSMLPQRITFTSIEGNFRLPIVRWLVKWIGVVPIPAATHRLKEFFAMTTEQLRQGRKVHFYPEGSLWPYAQEVRPFKKGAFHMASDADVPVIPAVIVQRRPRGPLRLLRKKPLFGVVFCPPVYPDPQLTGAKRIEDMRLRAQNAMTDVLENNKKNMSRDDRLV